MDEPPSRWVLAIRRILAEMRLTQGRAAEIGGISQNTLSELLCAKTDPKIGTVVKLVEALGRDAVECLATEEQARRLRTSTADVEVLRREIEVLRQQVNELRQEVASQTPPFHDDDRRHGEQQSTNPDEPHGQSRPNRRAR